MLGRTDWARRRVRAVSDEPIENSDARRVYARAILTQRDGGYHVALTGPQGSGILSSMALANALAVVPEDVPLIERGGEVEAILLD
jgi:molybdopterin molybdotransferase